MSVRHCAICGKEFERRFGDTAFTANCPDCDLQQWEAEQAAPLQIDGDASSSSSASFPVTISLIALNALVFAVMMLRGASVFGPTPQQAITFGADFGPLTLNGQWWRLVTSMFVHFGIIHIGLNMWCLWNLGCAAETLMGRFPYLLAYFVSGIFGSIASVYWHPMAVGAGASGAIFGLAGVLVSFVRLKKTPAHLQINSNMLSSLGTFILYNLVYGAAIRGVSNAAHVGGLVMGLAVGAVLPAASLPESSRRTRLSLVALLCAAVLAVSAVEAKRLRASASELASIQLLLEQRKTDEALARLKGLTAREPQLAPAHALLGSVYISKRQYPEAVSAFEKANSLAPSNHTYQQELGNAYLTARQFDQAIVFYRKLVSISPSDSNNFLGLGYAYMGLKNYDAAISEFRQAVALQPQNAALQYLLGRAQLEAGRYADAQITFRHLLDRFPDNPAAREGLDLATRQKPR